MLREHLDESHGAATRQAKERKLQIDWLWEKLGLFSGASVLDLTCGPGLYAVELARRGCQVTGIDFSPASIAYARDLAVSEGVADLCTFIEQDIRQIDYNQAGFDAALFIYGQLAVFKKEEAANLLQGIVGALRSGGRLAVELLDQERIDKKNSTWWFTDTTGLWGDQPFLHLGERFWNAAQEISIERFQIIQIETGELTEVVLCDQSYSTESMIRLMTAAGFSPIDIYPAWGNLPMYDAGEWVVYVATKE
jgi:SAM-dependent methyltransferase